jgi:hypothetical protein
MDTLQAAEHAVAETLAREVVDRIFGPGRVRAIWAEDMINADGYPAIRLFLAMRAEDFDATTGDEFVDNLTAIHHRFEDAGVEAPAIVSYATTDDPRAVSRLKG